MKEQEYAIKGTVDGMMKILQKDFNITDIDEARFIVYILVNQNDNKSIRAEELNIWYLDNQKQYNGQILNTHLTINFTDLKLSILQKSFQFFIRFVMKQFIDLPLLGAELIYTICTAINRISDTDYCVFARIIELNTLNKGRIFYEKEIITANKYGKCDHLDIKCDHLSKDNDDCTNSPERIEASLTRLSEQKIIKRAGEGWVLLD